MSEINKLYQVTQKNISLYEPSEKTPSDFQTLVDINTSLYISLIFDNKSIGLNYSRLISDYNFNDCTTWEAVADKLTEELIEGYSEDIPGYESGTDIPTRTIVTYDAMNVTNTFDIGYGNYTNGLKNLPHYKWNLPDICVSLQSNPEYVVDLTKCIPVVNGFVCKPYWNEQTSTLFGINGAQLCWQSGTHLTPEIQLLDLSQLCDEFELASIGEEFDLQFCNTKFKYDLGVDWILTSKYSLKEYTPILVLAGMVVFPDQLKYRNEFSFSFKPNRIPLDAILAYKTYLRNQANSKAEIAYNGEVVKDYLQGQVESNDFRNDCFVILLKNPKVRVTRIPLDTWNNSIVVNLYSQEGLLVSDRTQLIRAYHCDSYEDHKELMLQNMEPLFITDDTSSTATTAFIRPDCAHHDFKDIRKSNCTMLYLVS